MSKLISSPYIQPYPLQEFGGELGLTSMDIAKSLGVDHHKVKEKIKRNFDFYNDCSFFITHMVDNYYTVNVATAKYLIASWKSHIGKGYFQYLLSCEQTVEKEIPALKERLSAAMEYIGRKFKKKKVDRFVYVKRIIEKRDMFGILYVDEMTEKIPFHTLTDQERAAWEIRHNNNVAEGLTKKNRYLHDNVLYLPDTRPIRQLGPSKL